ncbi:MAG: response regulator [Deltaproteobacteria bacterium]|nr:response regulator [Deltaproteobacteria bacterium]
MKVGGKVKAVTMVVDDEQIVQESVRRILEEQGFRVDTAYRVDEALNLLNKTTYDLILTDLMMSNQNGMELVETAARDYPNTGIIMFTGYPSVASAVESIKLGALDYLPKPFTPEELLEVTERALSKVLILRKDKDAELVYEESEKALRSSLDLKKILDLVCSSSRDLLKVKGSSVLVRQKDGACFELATSCGLSDEYVSKGKLDANRSIAEVQSTGKSSFVDQTSFDKCLQYPDAARQEGIATILSMPLSVRGAIIGCLRVYSADDRKYDKKEMELITRFSQQAALAIENAVLYETMRKDIEGMKNYMS